MKTHFNVSAEEYEAHRQGAVYDRRCRLVRRQIDNLLPDLTRVVEIGCGPGGFLAALAADYPRLEFTGIDICPAMIEHAQNRHVRQNLQYRAGDPAQDGLADTAEFAFSIDVLHHVHALGDFFRGMRRLLVPGGVWLAVEPNIYHPYIYYSQERMRRAGFDEDHFRPWIAEPLLEQAGFGVRSRDYVSVFPGSIRRLPRLLSRLEVWCENCRFLGGSVVYLLQVPYQTDGNAGGHDITGPRGIPEELLQPAI